MIIKRIAKGIKEQDWFVVTVEIMIVVVGIFIGLQVGNWNEERKKDVLANETLYRLQADFNQIVLVARSSVEVHGQIIRSIEVLREALGEGLLRDDNRQEAMDALAQGDTHRTPASASSTFRELLSSGQLELIRNQELRLGLMRYDQSLSSTIQIQAQIRQMMTVYTPALKRHSVLSKPIRTVENGIETYRSLNAVDLDFEGLLVEPEIHTAIEQLLRLQIYIHLYHSNINQRIEGIRNLIASEIAMLQNDK